MTTSVAGSKTYASCLTTHEESSTKHLKEEVESLDGQMQAWHPFEEKTVSPLFEIKNAHQDDIHGFIQLGQYFVSGSKDTTVKVWDLEGKLFKVFHPPAYRRGYSYWVTALAPLNPNLFAVGRRDGLMTLLDLNNIVSDFEYSPSMSMQNQYQAKLRNKKRINCIVNSHDEGRDSIIFIGTPKFVQQWNAHRGKLLHYWQADVNDWVYCIEPLKRDQLIIVIGSRMELWHDIFSRAMTKSPLIQEKKSNQRFKQRPHISAILRLPDNQNLLSCALFDGSVRVVDICAQKVTHTFLEHVGRVWSVIQLEPNLIASSADDKTIKLWDLRQKNSLVTLGNNPGRVSSLLKIKLDQFISGSCPDDVSHSTDKASIRFWDIRTLKTHFLS